MKKLNLFALGFIALGLASCNNSETSEEAEEIVTETLNLDTENSRIEWVGEYYKGDTYDHNHEGVVFFKSGSIEFAEGVIQSGTFELDMNTIDEPNAPMGEETRVKFIGHLKSEDYFEVAKYPTATVKLTKCTPKSLVGTVTVKGVELPFDVAADIQNGEDAIKISGAFPIDFSTFGMEGIGKAGDPEYVSPQVRIRLSLRLAR